MSDERERARRGEREKIQIIYHIKVGYYHPLYVANAKRSYGVMVWQSCAAP